ncbi:hypothetical protein SAMN06297251_102181 [Fulvimarina manganoxydans]|uniref:Uncharacterized protein n=1 Tax=Fulvimarina manganoxydans TaxID=937218 RepID=A0A1W1Z5Y0_9HYPH|nr:hypothetical protein [Fulvimarina manganoxydans]MCK5934107.1 hypothetical protein [Fulvimarina manganoxydans]SMC43531.1 hypothetical protein SAMN06297251_102181 [Fulvimarina manganoxydans]
MATESLKHASFDHPTHGRFEDPAEVVRHSSLTREEKEEILARWKDEVGQGNEETGRKPGDAHTDLDKAVSDLAALKI